LSFPNKFPSVETVASRGFGSSESANGLKFENTLPILSPTDEDSSPNPNENTLSKSPNCPRAENQIFMSNINEFGLHKSIDRKRQILLLKNNPKLITLLIAKVLQNAFILEWKYNLRASRVAGMGVSDGLLLQITHFQL
jgi:hypothetical protein